MTLRITHIHVRECFSKTPSKQQHTNTQTQTHTHSISKKPQKIIYAPSSSAVASSESTNGENAKSEMEPLVHMQVQMVKKKRRRANEKSEKIQSLEEEGKRILSQWLYEYGHMVYVIRSSHMHLCVLVSFV